MKTIQLTQGKETIVDDEDYEMLMQWKWYFNNGYAKRTTGKRTKSINQKTIYMHRVIMNSPHGMVTDHINMDKLDNRRSNLRICNGHQNSCNQGKPISNTSGFKGVSLIQGKYHRARLCVLGKEYHLGLFQTKEAAYEAYCKAAPILHGEFARTS